MYCFVNHAMYNAHDAHHLHYHLLSVPGLNELQFLCEARLGSARLPHISCAWPQRVSNTQPVVSNPIVCDCVAPHCATGNLTWVQEQFVSETAICLRNGTVCRACLRGTDGEVGGQQLLTVERRVRIIPWMIYIYAHSMPYASVQSPAKYNAHCCIII